jgi:hydroxymethylpyrimidine/phosphomethylpyrimidine kinase
LQRKNDKSMTKGTILTITGSDATGESGIQADIRTISALGCVALSAITSVTMQNTIGIQEFYDIPAPVVGGQIEAIVNDVQPQAVKIGMVRRSETLDVIVRALRSYRPDFVIYDPLLFSSRGDRLMGDDMLRHIQTQLLPLCTAIVVNRHDARQILGDAIRPNVFFIDDAYDGLVLQGLFGIADALLSFVALRFGFLALKPGGNAGLFCVVCPLRHLSALLL